MTEEEHMAALEARRKQLIRDVYDLTLKSFYDFIEQHAERPTHLIVPMYLRCGLFYDGTKIDGCEILFADVEDFVVATAKDRRPGE